MEEKRLSQDDYVFQSREGDNKPLTRQMVNHILTEASIAVGLDKGYSGTHTMRKTFSYWAWKSGVRLDVLLKEGCMNPSLG